MAVLITLDEKYTHQGTASFSNPDEFTTYLDLNLETKRINQEGDITWEYQPLRNLRKADGSLTDFNTDEIVLDLNNSVNIECQPSYDGTVNLILNDDKNPPRIINSRFTVMEDKRYKRIDRAGNYDTNIYDEGSIDRDTRLFKNSTNVPFVKFKSLTEGGNLLGGNYTFYFKYIDADGNESDIVCESGIISAYVGLINDPASIRGGMLDENANKNIVLSLNNIDATYDKLAVYYTRATSDFNGIETVTAWRIEDFKDILGSTTELTITGFESKSEISIENLNVEYNIVDQVKTQTQVQNMLFFGNVSKPTIPFKDLEDLSLRIATNTYNDDAIAAVDETYSVDSGEEPEYFSAENVYYKTGYWDQEIYRLGIVYIMIDDSLTPVFNLRGASGVNADTIYDIPALYDSENNRNYIDLPSDGFALNSLAINENYKGVVQLKHFTDSSKPWFNSESINPIGLKFTFQEGVIDELKTFKIKGFFFVRQKRIPTILAQGVAVGIEAESYVPCLTTGDEYFTESFITSTGLLTHDFERRKLKSSNVYYSGLVSPEVSMNKVLQNSLAGKKYKIGLNSCIPMSAAFKQGINEPRHFYIENYKRHDYAGFYDSGLMYVPQAVSIRSQDSKLFSSKVGIAEEAYKLSKFGRRMDDSIENNFIRGEYMSFLATESSLPCGYNYNIFISGYNSALMREYFTVRMNSFYPYYAIGNRYDISYLDSLYDNVSGGTETSILEYRGDCFVNTVTTRVMKNFQDPETPINDTIVDQNTWKENYVEVGDLESNANINRSDVNAVNIGHWMTYKVCSNYNLAYRSIDDSNEQEMALAGRGRGFHPYYDMSPRSENNNLESSVYNSGYSSSTSDKRYVLKPDVPYLKNIFDNRILFSQKFITDAFQNSYRVFQGLAYQDITRQYGAIVKLLDWKENILCVFEHGIALIPINEKALIGSEAGQSIHMYASEVLQERVSVVSPDFGSIWPDSIIRTPMGIYGVDTNAKKIWKVTFDGQFQAISDFKIQDFLNKNITLEEDEITPIVGLRNVKTHYNLQKGDVMFTFYDNTSDSTGQDHEKSWSVCWNEFMNSWITQYSWVPLSSENINNIYFSTDREVGKRMSLLGYSNASSSWAEGVVLDNLEINKTDTLVGNLDLKGYDYDSLEFELLDDEWNTKYVCSDESVINLLDYFNIKLNGNKYELHLTSPGVLHPEFYYILKVRLKYETGYAVGAKTKYYFDDFVLVRKDATWFASNLDYQDKLDEYFKVYFWKHNQAGIISDRQQANDPNNLNKFPIYPTKWYDKQEKFEFEFVCRADDKVGIQKIWNNLQIISNKAAPETVEYEIVGENYDFYAFKKDSYDVQEGTWTYATNGNIIAKLLNGEFKYDATLDEYRPLIVQPIKQLTDPRYGRLKGNAHYREDMWDIVCPPVRYQLSRYLDLPLEEQASAPVGPEKETRLRDKYVKVRVKYSGEDLAVILALQTIYITSHV